MTEYEFSEHAHKMLKERKIRQDWVTSTMETPDRIELKDDGTVHHIRAIEAYGGRSLRVVVNPKVTPQRIVTLFFDRRLRSQS
ncbi:MAG: DUF4258 domain-containing protein [bacterium]